MYHALQEDRKLCVSFYTRDVDRIINVFSDREKYDYYVKPILDEEHKGFSFVFVSKKGCLTDYFDMEKIEKIYEGEAFRVCYL